MEELKKLSEKYVVSYCEIPEELTEEHWTSEYMSGCFVEVHIDEEDNDDEITTWIKEKYPFLVKEESFFIEIDY